MARLRRLKTSSRNCKLCCSVKGTLRVTEISSVANPGPIIVFLPRVPRRPLGCNSKAETSK